MTRTRTTKNLKPTKTSTTASKDRLRRSRKLLIEPATLAALTAPTPSGVAVTPPTDAVAPRSKPLSGLAAAAQVLRDAGEPLDVKTLVKRLLEQGLWSSAGKTPAATIYAAIIREIRTKGAVSRFRKTDRGRFAAAD
jgi:hypothetical protein